MSAMPEEQLDIEAYAKAEAGAVVSVLSKVIGPFGAADASGDDPMVFEFRGASVVVWAIEGGFLSVWVRGKTPWSTCVGLGRFLAKELHCTVRCDPGAEFPDLSPHANVFLEIEADSERLTAWG